MKKDAEEMLPAMPIFLLQQLANVVNSTDLTLIMITFAATFNGERSVVDYADLVELVFLLPQPVPSNMTG